MRTRFKKLIRIVGHSLYKIIRIPFVWYRKIYRIQTRGVRVLIIFQNEIVLVRHWYNSLWVPPGGGIKKHETPEQAAIREVKEETGIEIKQLSYLLGTYSNTKNAKNDIVYCYVVELNQKLPIPNKRFNFEISDSIWIDMHMLPHQTSSATQKRIKEYIHKEISTQIRPWS